MPYRHILYERDERIARIALNRPRYRNVQSTELIHELDDAIAKAADDRDVRVILLTGSGDHFSAGHDIGTPEETAWREAKPMEAGVRGFYDHTWRLYVDMHLRWRNVPKPMIAAVQGYCIFGGWMVAATADIVFAAEDALFLGSLFQYFAIPWDVHPRRAKELLFQGRFVNGLQAKELGLVNRALPKETLIDEALAYARDVAQNDPFELRMIKLAVNNAEDIRGFTAAIHSAHAIYMLNRTAESDPGYALPKPEGRRRPMVQVALERYRKEEEKKGEEQAMKAVLLTGHGGPEMLRYGDAPDPVPGPGEVVVDIHAASVNAADYKVRLGGSAYGNIKLRFPHVLGRDFSGVVSALGAAVSDFAVGDAVFGVTDQGIEGCYAEKLAIKAAIIARKPAALAHDAAAALALTSLTALWAIEDTARLRRGETILIQGGAGGVAGFAIRLAKHLGATVITTASAGNHDYVQGLGADRVIDYHHEDFARSVTGCDVVFDTVGGAVRAGCYAVLKPGGRLVWISPTPEGFQVPRNDVETLRPNVVRDRAHLERMLTLLAAGAVTPPPIRRYPLAEAAEAHRVSEARHLQGKLVLMVR